LHLKQDTRAVVHKSQRLQWAYIAFLRSPVEAAAKASNPKGHILHRLDVPMGIDAVVALMETKPHYASTLAAEIVAENHIFSTLEVGKYYH
jgi:hypothetical protein